MHSNLPNGSARRIWRREHACHLWPFADLSRYSGNHAVFRTVFTDFMRRFWLDDGFTAHKNLTRPPRNTDEANTIAALFLFSNSSAVGLIRETRLDARAAQYAAGRGVAEA